MNELYFPSIVNESRDVDELKDDINELMNKRNRNSSESEQVQFVNTEAALSWILRGSIDYFNELETVFLGEGNTSGIPEIKADQFANNFYRLSNAIKYLSEILKLNYNQCDEFNLLNDLRTLIVHSGEQIDKIISPEFNQYKDMQLGRIFFRGSNKFDIDFLKSAYDYKVEIWADKKDKTKNKYNPDEKVKIQKENQKDISIYINSHDVRNVVLYEIDKFLILANENEIMVNKIERLPLPIKEEVISTCDFEKLEKLIKFKKKGEYFIRGNIAYWDGFGLKKLHHYASYRNGIDKATRDSVIQIIKRRLNEYYDAFNDEYIKFEDLPSLDVRDVFREYTPEYEKKHYYEGEKLFTVIAPRFNTSDGNFCGRVEMLAEFSYRTSMALGINLELNNSVDDVICDYFVKSVELKTRNI